MQIPFVWHFKEGPHEAMKLGLWDKLIDLYTKADGKIYLNDEIKKWFELFIPSHLNNAPTLILDGDLPKIDVFHGTFSEKLSSKDGEIHTVIMGRIIGLIPNEVRIMAQNGVHIHVYSENYISDKTVMDKYKREAPGHFHVHSHCSQHEWVKEFSKYDAGWLHCFNSTNNNFLLRATWSDLNLPARINTLAAAGIPIIQKKNLGHIVAMRNYIDRYGMCVFYNTIDELIDQLKDKELLNRVEQNVRMNRLKFTFDYHLPKIIDFFKNVIYEFHQK